MTASLRVWAPGAESVAAVLGDDRRPMTAARADGWWELDEPVNAGTDYAFSIDDGPPLPDPRSAWQPHGVHGPSRVVDFGAFPWSDQLWRGVPLPGAVIYELHVGTFTDEGTFDAAIGKLDHLVDLGVGAVELLPVNAFPGEHGWGYDGVGLYAVQHSYGGPDGLKRFVDACHARGVGVVMDVVYNHLGPAGNYLSQFGPYFTDTHTTPWGPAVNLDAAGSNEVRAFVLDNVRMWLRDYHIDGLRLDAVHALQDDRATHLLEEMSAEVAALAAHVGRPLFLIAESDLNDPRLVTSREAGGYGLDAQWADDIHHALHSALTGERQGYYVDFGSLSTLAKVLTSVFVHDGSWSTFRGRDHGRPVDRERTPGWRFLAYLQDHDQVGNRAQGDRISASLSPGLLKIGAALVLTGPFTPMLWMGEEWGASTPWQFFTDHDPDLGALVREGRRAEFTSHGWGPEEVPDPQDPETFRRSKLNWAEAAEGAHTELLTWYRDLCRLRRVWPELTDGRLDRVEVDYNEQQRWLVMRRNGISVLCNLSTEERLLPLSGPAQLLLASGTCRLDDVAAVVAPETVAIVAGA